MNSDRVKKGTDRAAHRSLLKALGLRDEDIRKPWIGVASAWNEVVPGHAHLDRIAAAVKAGILAAGGTPFEFGVIGVCDGLAMGHEGMRYSLPSRELVADSLEIMARAHAFDGLVLVTQLRQDHAGDAHGGGPAGRPVDPGERRADARRAGSADAPSACRTSSRPSGSAASRPHCRTPSSANTKTGPAPAAARAPGCSRPTA